MRDYQSLNHTTGTVSTMSCLYRKGGEKRYLGRSARKPALRRRTGIQSPSTDGWSESCDDRQICTEASEFVLPSYQLLPVCGIWPP